MFTASPSLKDLTQSVPVCQPTAKLDAVLEMFRACHCSRVVVVDRQNRPLGLLRLESLVFTAREKGKRNQLKPLMQPLPTLPTELPLNQVWRTIQQPQASEIDKDWAVVDGENKFLGLLDIWSALKYLEPQNQGVSLGMSQEMHSTSVKGLVQLLKQLPLPLMLQTDTGEAIAQNPAWHEQIGISQLPDLAPGESISLISAFPSASPASKLGENHSEKRLERDWSDRGRHFFASEAMPFNEQSVSTDCQTLTAIPDSTHSLGKFIAPVERQLLCQFVKVPLRLTSEPQHSFTSCSSELWLVLATDITEKQQVAKELAAKNADLVQLNRMKDEFLACISHELKTPLTAVLGLSSLLKDRLLGDLNERQVHYLQMIHQGGRQLMMVVNDILDLARMETGQLELTLEPVRIKTVCDRAYSQVHELSLAKDKDRREEEAAAEIPFSLEIESGLEMLIADESRLRQMLIHLLSNALKFTKPGGQIGLRVNLWEGWVAFTVWDTGIGIPPDKQHLIFQKFQQLENPLNREFEGTGLGLVLTQHLARLHGGEVSFISQAGQGSQFTLLLPPSPPQSDAVSEFTPFKPLLLSHSNRLVLLVEAVPDYIEQLTQQLIRFGYRVVIARSGTEAMEKSRRLQPCAILLNPLLPLLSGWDVLTLLKSDRQTCHIPVLVTATCAEKEQAQENQADGFLSLPVDPLALQKSLKHLTQSPTQTGAKGDNSYPPRKSPILLFLNPSDRQDSTTLTQKIALDRLPASGENYRIIEADDLEQAELLTHFWHPDVVILDSRNLTDPLPYLQQLARYSKLASLPLITLDRKTAEVANQVSKLSVFPCLPSVNSNAETALWQVIQVAVGIGCQPHILIMDLASLSQGSDEWVQALIHYLQAAGFTSLVSRSWGEVLSQLQPQNIDLLAIVLGDTPPDSEQLQALAALGEQVELPSVLILDRSTSDRAVPIDELYPALKAVCTHRVKVDSQSMSQLLELIQRTLTQSH